jgi:chromosome segregation ATPase
LAVVLTVFLHHRKRKLENTAMSEGGEKLLLATPELVGYTKGDGEYICFDHSPLISQYKQRLSYNHARYAALRHDFEKLEHRFSDLVSYASVHFKNKKKLGMENTPDQIPQPLQEEIDKLAAQYRKEKEELHASLERMNQSYKSLEDENQSLLDQVKMQTASGEEKEAILLRWQEENRALKEKVAEQQYLHDILQEKKAQIDFLQNQLEQRIRSNHQVEQQRVQAQTELEELKNIHRADIHEADGLKSELMQKQEELDKLQVILCGKEEQWNEMQQLLSTKLEHITWLETNLQETKEQNEKLNVFVSESRLTVGNLEQQLSDEREKLQAAEQKLYTSKQSFQKLFKEFENILQEENSQSPVIPLRTGFNDHENKEMAVN